MDKLMLFLGLVVKAGKMTFGYNLTEADIHKGKCALVLIADDISERTLKNTELLCEKNGIDMVRINRDMDMIADSLGKRSGVLSVTDVNFAKRIKELIDDDQAL